jgi:hypothetical protein
MIALIAELILKIWYFEVFEKTKISQMALKYIFLVLLLKIQLHLTNFQPQHGFESLILVPIGDGYNSRWWNCSNFSFFKMVAESKMADTLNFDRKQSISTRLRIVNAFWKRLAIFFQWKILKQKIFRANL